MIIRLCGKESKNCEHCRMTQNAANFKDGVPYRYECIAGGDCLYVKLYDEEKQKFFAKPKVQRVSFADDKENGITYVELEKMLELAIRDINTMLDNIWKDKHLFMNYPNHMAMRRQVKKEEYLEEARYYLEDNQ